MSTSQERIRDELLEHQFYSIKFASGLTDRAISILAKTEPELADIIRKYAERLEGKSVASPYSRNQLRKMDAEIKTLRLGAWAEIQKIFKKEFSGLALLESGFLARVIEKNLPVQIKMSRPKAEDLRTVGLNTPYDGLIFREWINKTASDDLHRIGRVTRLGVKDADTTEQLVRRIIGTKRLGYKDGIVRKAWTHTEALAYTVTTGVQTEARTLVAQQNPLVIEKEKFIATLDSGTTLVCIDNDGEIFDVGKGKHPPLHFRCRSQRIPSLNIRELSRRPANPTVQQDLLNEFTKTKGFTKVSARDDLPYGQKNKFDAYADKRKRELIGPIPSDINYPEWLKGRSVEFQNKVLGVRRAEMFRNGTPISKFVNRTGGTITLDELEKIN